MLSSLSRALRPPEGQPASAAPRRTRAPLLHASHCAWHEQCQYARPRQRAPGVDEPCIPKHSRVGSFTETIIEGATATAPPPARAASAQWSDTKSSGVCWCSTSRPKGRACAGSEFSARHSCLIIEGYREGPLARACVGLLGPAAMPSDRGRIQPSAWAEERRMTPAVFRLLRRASRQRAAGSDDALAARGPRSARPPGCRLAPRKPAP
jgi:hypothetical protein